MNKSCDIIHLGRLVPRGQMNPNTGVAYESLDTAITRYLHEIGPLPVEPYIDSYQVDGRTAIVTLDKLIGSVIDYTDEDVTLQLNERGKFLRDSGLLKDAKVQFCFLGDIKVDNVVKIVSAGIVYNKE